jgi:hypothetical protein
MNSKSPIANSQIRRPSKLQPGVKIICDGRPMTFVKREPAYGPRGARNVFLCPDYAGLNGPQDDGKCEMTDPYVVKNCRRAA